MEEKLEALAVKVREHREVLLTEEAAKNALVMPFLAALGYDVFDPREVVPEFTCDVGTKKGEKVDYAICRDGEVAVLIECKPASAALNLNHAGQLYRYFSVTNAKFAILTNGCEYQIYTDLVAPNRMDEKPFFSFSLTDLSKGDVRTLAKFHKSSFDEDGIVRIASSLQLETSVARYLKSQMTEPSEELVRLVAANVHDGRVTEAVRETVSRTIINGFASIVNERIKDRLQNAMTPTEAAVEDDADEVASDVITTQAEIDGFHIVRAICSQLVDPKRIIMRDAKSYCAVLLDDNNRKTLARLWFNSETARYFATFEGKEETKHPISAVEEIYQHADKIRARIEELGA